MSYSLTMASGRTVELPAFDPIVAAHLQNPASNVPELLRQINDAKIYDKLFVGRKNLTFLDIGANIGLVSLYASDNCSRIVAVEPSPTNFAVLKALTFMNAKIEPVHAALAPQDGKSEFYENDVNSTASSTVNIYGIPMEVNGFTLSSLLKIYQLEHVDVCKIDCEGCEGDSLKLHELSQCAPVIDNFYIETHNCPFSTWESKLNRITNDLTALGYNTKTNGMVVIARK